MLKWILLALVIVFLAFDAAIYFKIEPLYGFITKTILPTVQGFITQAQGFISSSPLAPYLPTLSVSAIGAGVAYLIRYRSNQKQQQIREAAQQAQLEQAHDYQTAQSQLLQDINKLQTQNTALQNQVNTYQVSQQNYSSQQEYVDDLEERLKTKITENNQLNTMFSNLINDPNYQDYLRVKDTNAYRQLIGQFQARMVE